MSYFIKASIYLHLILSFLKQIAFAMHLSVNFGRFDVTQVISQWATLELDEV